jgi:hypothetical protein
MAIYDPFRSLHCDTWQPGFGSALDELVPQPEAKPVKTRFEIRLYRNSETLVVKGMQSGESLILEICFTVAACQLVSLIQIKFSNEASRIGSPWCYAPKV